MGVHCTHTLYTPRAKCPNRHRVTEESSDRRCWLSLFYTASCVVVPHKRRAAKTSPRLTYVMTCRYNNHRHKNNIIYIPMVVIIIVIAYNNFLVMIDHISVGVFSIIMFFRQFMNRVIYYVVPINSMYNNIRWLHYDVRFVIFHFFLPTLLFAQTSIT